MMRGRCRRIHGLALAAAGVLLLPASGASASGDAGAAAGPAPGSGPAQQPPTARASTPAPGPLVLSLDQAVESALRGNPTLEQAAAAVRRAEGAVDEVLALRRPRVDGTAQFTLQGPIPTFTFTTPPARPGDPPGRREIAFGRTLTKSFGVSALYDPDPFGRRRDLRASAEGAANVARGGLFVTRNELVYAVQALYLAALRGQELTRVAAEAVEAAGEQLRVARAQFEAGVAPEFDVLRASVQVANLRQGQVAAEAAHRRTLAGLAELLSLPPAAPIRLLPVALPPEPDAVAAATARKAVQPPPAAEPAPAPDGVPPTLEAALEEAIDRRPEIYQALWNRRAAEARVEFQRKGKRPEVSARANLFYNPDQTGLAVEPRSWSLVANIAIPIWDAGLTRARVRQARAEVDAAAAQLEAARDAVAEEVRRALIDLEEAAERRRAAAANVEQAREALRIARIRYSSGLAPNVEVTDAEVALTQARTNEVNAAYDHLAALAGLNRALGRFAGVEGAGSAGDAPVAPRGDAPATPSPAAPPRGPDR